MPREFTITQEMLDDAVLPNGDFYGYIMDEVMNTVSTVYGIPPRTEAKPFEPEYKATFLSEDLDLTGTIVTLRYQLVFNPAYTSTMLRQIRTNVTKEAMEYAKESLADYEVVSLYSQPHIDAGFCYTAEFRGTQPKGIPRPEPGDLRTMSIKELQRIRDANTAYEMPMYHQLGTTTGRGIPLELVNITHDVFEYRYTTDLLDANTMDLN